MNKTTFNSSQISKMVSVAINSQKHILVNCHCEFNFQPILFKFEIYNVDIIIYLTYIKGFPRNFSLIHFT